MVGAAGLEPATLYLEGTSSLSIGTLALWVKVWAKPEAIGGGSPLRQHLFSKT